MKRLNKWLEQSLVALPFWLAYVVAALVFTALYCIGSLGLDYFGGLLGRPFDLVGELLGAPVMGLTVALPLVVVTRGRVRHASRARSVRITRRH